MSELTVNVIKKQAKRMQLSFVCRGIDLKLGHCYEALAAMHGYKNWDTFCAILKRRGDQDNDSVGNI